MAVQIKGDNRNPYSDNDRVAILVGIYLLQAKESKGGYFRNHFGYDTQTCICFLKGETNLGTKMQMLEEFMKEGSHRHYSRR